MHSGLKEVKMISKLLIIILALRFSVQNEEPKYEDAIKFIFKTNVRSTDQPIYQKPDFVNRKETTMSPELLERIKELCGDGRLCEFRQTIKPIRRSSTIKKENFQGHKTEFEKMTTSSPGYVKTTTQKWSIPIKEVVTNKPISIKETEIEYKSCGLNKICVPYYLCKNGSINNDGAGILDIRFGNIEEACPLITDTCCSLNDQVINSTQTKSDKTHLLSPNINNSANLTFFTHKPSEAVTVKGPPESESINESDYKSCGINKFCVPFNLCDNTTNEIITDGSGLLDMRIDFDTCSNTEVCCYIPKNNQTELIFELKSNKTEEIDKLVPNKTSPEYESCGINKICVPSHLCEDYIEEEIVGDYVEEIEDYEDRYSICSSKVNICCDSKKVKPTIENPLEKSILDEQNEKNVPTIGPPMSFNYSEYTSCGINKFCVPFSLCNENTKKIITDGEDLIDARIDLTISCLNDLEVCCELDTFTEDSSSVSNYLESTTVFGNLISNYSSVDEMDKNLTGISHNSSKTKPSLVILNIFNSTTETSNVNLPTSSENSTSPVGNNSSYQQCDLNKYCVPHYLCNNITNSVITNALNENFDLKTTCFLPLEVCCILPNSFNVWKSNSKTNPKHVTQEELLKALGWWKPHNSSLDSSQKKGKQGCGLYNPNELSSRITDNNEAEYGEFPWMIAVLREINVYGKSYKTYQCGGSLIHPSVILTTAYCVYRRFSDELIVRAGEYDLKTINENYNEQERKISKIILHEHFSNKQVSNDIALLVTQEKFELNEVTNTICLPPQNLILDNNDCIASGWGKNKYGSDGTYQNILKKIDLSVAPNKVCETKLKEVLPNLRKRFKLHESFVCAGGERNQDTCTGDGGGPLICPFKENFDKYFQYGIVSWGIKCGLPIPGVYTNVQHFRNWIDDNFRELNFDMKYYML